MQDYAKCMVYDILLFVDNKKSPPLPKKNKKQNKRKQKESKRKQQNNYKHKMGR